MRRCSRQISTLHRLTTLPSSSSSSHLPSCLILPRRTLLDLTRPTKDAGLAPAIISDDPGITSKLAAVDQTNPLSTAHTALSTVINDAQSDELVSKLVALLPEIDTEAVWLPVVVWAVGFRAVHCLYSRIVTGRGLERSLPYADWYYRKDLELSFWKDKRNFDKVDEIGMVIDQHSSDHNLVGGPRRVRRKALGSAVMLSYVNICGLYFFSEIYKPQLSEAPFLWSTSLLQADPLYILPAANLALCYFLYRLGRQENLYPSKFAKPGLPSNLSYVPQGPLPRSNLISKSFSVLFGGSLFLFVSNQIPALYFLFWTSSNIAGVLVSFTLAKSNFVRKKVKLLPKQEFKLLLAKNDIIIDTEAIEAEKKRMNKKEEEAFEKSKQKPHD
ncbi:hypothetical protein ACHWQZ_G003632 [Mnemiopsis leidyi]